MSVKAGDAAACAPGGDLVRVAIGSLSLVLPEQDVDSVESVLDMNRAGAGDGPACGHLALAGASCPVYALSERLDLVRTVEPRGRVCIVIAAEAGPMAVLADAASRLDAAGVRRCALPACMRTGGGLLLGLAVVDSAPLFEVSGASLGAWLTRTVAEPAAIA